MKTYTVYIDTHTGRSQVTLEAETVKVNQDTYEFLVGDTVVAVFAREKSYGYVEERVKPAWEEAPPER